MNRNIKCALTGWSFTKQQYNLLSHSDYSRFIVVTKMTVALYHKYTDV